MGSFAESEILPLMVGVAGAGLLCCGLGIGAWLGRRRGRIRTDNSLSDYHMGKLMRSLFHWTDDVATDVSRYRKLVESLKRQIQAAEQASPQEDPEAFVRLFSRIVQANDLLQQRLDNAELALKEQAVEITSYMSEARTDKLTGLPNRRVFDEELSRRMAEFHRHGHPVGVLLVDIDHFKRFNDRYGHLAGDAVLAHVGKVLHATMRETDLVARLGGEEFSILLPNPDPQGAPSAAERVRSAVENAVVHYDGKALRVTVSCGLAFATVGEDAKGVVNRADQALYASKAANRNCAHWHNGRETIAVARDAAAADASAVPVTAAPGVERRREDFAQVCDDLRRKLKSVVSS